MPSLIAWLDASSEEQRRMRDIISLFTDTESRDELGLSTIRDPLGDILFPGTSVLLTRARYLLFVPWIYAQAAGKPNATVEADRAERSLIATLKTTDDHAGLLGMTAGAALKTLPSSVYWGMLGRYGIRAERGATRAETLASHGAVTGGGDLESEGTRHRAWAPSIPNPPHGFPKEVPGGFALRHDEAEWLRERILTHAPNTLFAHLAHDAPSTDSSAPWEDAAALRIDGQAKQDLLDARAFSGVMHGAQLLYNLLLAEAYEEAGFTSVENPIQRYRARLREWAETLPGMLDVSAWNTTQLFGRVEAQRGAPLPVPTRMFVDAWDELVRSTATGSIADSADARALVSKRERQSKGAQARIGNQKRLVSWQGGSGAGALVYRWGTARRILLDIHDGLDAPLEATSA